MENRIKLSSRKGQVFTIDALFAVVIVVIFAALTVGYSFEQKSLRGELYKERFAEDALIALDRSGVLGSGNATLMNSTLASLVPNTLNWSLNITTYAVNGSTLTQLNSLRYGGITPNETDIFVSQRRFISYTSGAAANVSVARMEVW